MTEMLIGLLVFLLLLGALTRETFVIVIIYLGMGSWLLSRWWITHVLARVQFSREFENKAFPGETIPVKIAIHNRSMLPAVWLRIQDYFPIEVADQRQYHQIITLGPRQQLDLNYQLKPQKRGYYPIGPLDITSGDLLGLSSEQSTRGQINHLTVYPRIINLTNPFLPSNSPMGTLRHRQPVFEDPSRPIGKRDYQAGDSLRRIDWKSSASVGRLQVKQFEPSIALETAIFLNLNLEEYSSKDWVDATELAIVTAASLANWVIAKRQSTSFYTNGADQLNPTNSFAPLPNHKGRPHLMRILEALARIKPRQTTSFSQFLQHSRPNLAWGTTLIIISGSADHHLFEELLQAKRAGMSILLVLCGWNTGAQEARSRGKNVGIAVVDILDDDSFKIWQR
jgi:uncharacterized protein (DUF58 family)